MIEIDFRPNKRTLGQFGWIALGGFSFLALIAWFEWFIFAFGLGAARPWLTGGFAALGLLAAFFSLVAPAANRWLYVGMAMITFPIGFVISYIILGFMFFVLLMPVGLFFRLKGRDALNLRLKPEAETYWTPARPRRPNESYFRQF